ncbi:MAG: DUF1727 domain-containing protein, partial [Cutibacterium avidum]|nr:DUF1727 domain-containing protein [Cutibacterium avidum]
MTSSPGRHRTSPRLQLALLAGRTAATASRLAGRGSGASIRGRVTMTLAPRALPELLADRRVASVTGTNGKTTTTHFLTAAVKAGTPDGQRN